MNAQGCLRLCHPARPCHVPSAVSSRQHEHSAYVSQAKVLAQLSQAAQDPAQ